MCGFGGQADSITYLGIQVSSSWEQPRDINYHTVSKDIKDLISNWNNFIFSFEERLQLVKMILLPKIIYLIQTISIYPKRTYLKEINNILLKFLWHPKKPRLAYVHHIRSWNNGGMKFPHIETYFKPAIVKLVVHLLDSSYTADWKILVGELMDVKNVKITPQNIEIYGNNFWLAISAYLQSSIYSPISFYLNIALKNFKQIMFSDINLKDWCLVLFWNHTWLI